MPLEPVGVQLDGVDYARGAIHFIRAGWCEVLLAVSWDPENQDGSRFAHTSIPDQHPLHSEAI